jgi:hypothetical protein
MYHDNNNHINKAIALCANYREAIYIFLILMKSSQLSKMDIILSQKRKQAQRG